MASKSDQSDGNEAAARSKNLSSNLSRETPEKKKKTPESERKKFEIARELHGKLGSIRNNYRRDFDLEPNTKENQLGILIHLLDETGYRPGSQDVKKKDDKTNQQNEKNDETGVGFRSVCMKHITSWNDDEEKIHFYFIGKYRVLFDKDVKVDEKAYNIMKNKWNNKRSGDDKMFEKVKYHFLRDYLNTKYKITPKVFRTYKASSIFEKKLEELTKEWIDRNGSKYELREVYDSARDHVKDELNHLHQKSGESYIDPRIIMAWCKAYDVHPSDILTDKEREDMEWASKEVVDANFKFIAEFEPIDEFEQMSISPKNF